MEFTSHSHWLCYARQKCQTLVRDQSFPLFLPIYTAQQWQAPGFNLGSRNKAELPFWALLSILKVAQSTLHVNHTESHHSCIPSTHCSVLNDPYGEDIETISAVVHKKEQKDFFSQAWQIETTRDFSNLSLPVWQNSQLCFFSLNSNSNLQSRGCILWLLTIKRKATASWQLLWSVLP